MIKRQFLYINLDASSPNIALARSVTNTSPTTFGSVVVGDTLQLVLIPIDANGATSSVAGDSNYQVKVGIGGLGDGALALSTNFKASASYGWTGSLNTDTGSLISFMGTNDTVSSYLEIEFTASGSLFDSGSRYTVAQLPITLRGQVIPNS